MTELPAQIPDWSSRAMSTLGSPYRGGEWTPGKRHRRIWPYVLGVPLLIVALVTGAIVFFQWRQARLVVHVSPLSPSAKECAQILTSEHQGHRNVRMCQSKLPHLPWFRAEVTNVGHRSTYIACSIKALGSGGQVLFSGARPPTLNGVFADFIPPGKSLAWEYYLPKPLKIPVARYVGQCNALPRPII